MVSTKTLSFIFCEDSSLNTLAKKVLTSAAFANTNAHEALRLVAASNEKHSGRYLVTHGKVQNLMATKRDNMNFVNDVDRTMRQGGDVHPADMERYNAAKEENAEIDAAVKELRAPGPGNLPVETLIKFMAGAKGKFVNAAAVKSAAPKGTSFAEAVEASRAAIDGSKRRIIEVRKRAITQSDAEKRLVENVKSHALAPDFVPVTRSLRQVHEHYNATRELPDRQGDVEWPSREEYFEGGRRMKMDEGVRFMCWLMPDLVIERGKAEIAKSYKDGPGVAREERARLIAEIEADILAEERREEALIRMAEDGGQTIWRRPLANPLAVLGIQPA